MVEHAACTHSGVKPCRALLEGGGRHNLLFVRNNYIYLKTRMSIVLGRLKSSIVVSQIYCISRETLGDNRTYIYLKLISC